MKKVCAFLIISCFLAFFPNSLLSSDNIQTYMNLSLGEKIPSLLLLDNLTEEERQYLGLSKGLFHFHKKDTFLLEEIQADYIIVEFLNRYCISCMVQASILNRLYQKILQDDGLRDRIKILAVGVGNNQKEMHQFRIEKKVSFPMVPDPRFSAYETIGDPGGTPYFLVLRKTPHGFLLVESRLGLIKNEKVFLDTLKELLPLDLASLKKKIRERMKLETRTLARQISLSEEEVRERIKYSILGEEKQDQISIEKKNFSDYGTVYIINTVPGAKKRWFAKEYTRPPVCDICHPVSFFLIFNGHGRVTDFIPVYLPKYGNSPFTEEDIRNVRRKIVGRDIEKTYQFQPEYDSVTGATMSVSLIFNSVNKARGLYIKLQEDGYISGTFDTQK